jgi:hypothetical protein
MAALRTSIFVQPYLVQITVFWDVTPCSLVDTYQCFRDTMPPSSEQNYNENRVPKKTFGPTRTEVADSHDGDYEVGHLLECDAMQSSSRFLQNVSEHLPDYRASHPTRQFITTVVEYLKSGLWQMVGTGISLVESSVSTVNESHKMKKISVYTGIQDAWQIRRFHIFN